MSALFPSARIELDGTAYGPAEAALVRLRIELGVGDRHDAAFLSVAPGSPLEDTPTGAALSLELGPKDALESAFSGEVISVETRSEGTRISALAPSHRLSQVRSGQAFVGENAADIARSLLDLGAADAGEITAPLSVGLFLVDEKSTVWSHLRRLARLAGCETSSDASGAVNFRAPKAGPRADHRLRYGAELLSWNLLEAEKAIAPVAAAYGAGSEAGADKGYLLLKDPTGGPPADPTFIPAAVRARDAADAVTKGWSDRRHRRGRGGSTSSLGRPEIRAGDLVEIVDLPDAPIPPLLRALAVRHIFDGHQGFTTSIRLGGPAGGPGMP